MNGICPLEAGWEVETVCAEVVGLSVASGAPE